MRVIRTEAEFHKLKSGDVLVCPITSPVWSVLFPNIGALVTDTGGATRRLQDGQMVIMDGTHGPVLPAGYSAGDDH